MQSVLRAADAWDVRRPKDDLGVWTPVDGWLVLLGPKLVVLRRWKAGVRKLTGQVRKRGEAGQQSEGGGVCLRQMTSEDRKKWRRRSETA
jgi:hypothetical protein